MVNDKPLIAISACLLGAPVRYDGGSKPSVAVLNALDEHVRWLPICPEVGAGAPVPRPPVSLLMVSPERRQQLAAQIPALKMHRNDDFHDMTADLLAYCEQMGEQFITLGVSGLVSKSRSPSCGLSDTPHYVLQKNGSKEGGNKEGDAEQFDFSQPVTHGAGLFVAWIQKNLPHLPIADENHFIDIGGSANTNNLPSSLIPAELFLQRSKKYALNR